MLSSTNGPSCRERSSFIVENSIAICCFAIQPDGNEKCLQNTCKRCREKCSDDSHDDVFLEAILPFLFVLVSQNCQAVKDSLQAGTNGIECELV